MHITYLTNKRLWLLTHTFSPPCRPSPPYFFLFPRGRPSPGFRLMTTCFHRGPLTGSSLCNISHLSLPWKQWWERLLSYPATTWKVTPTTQETSFFTTFFFPAKHFLTDGVKLCSTNCLNIIFSAVGWGWGGCCPSQLRKNIIFEVYLTQW